MSKRALLLFVAVGVLWGTPYLFIRVAIRDFDPGTLVFFRSAIGAAILFPIAALRGQLRLLIPYWRPVLAFAIVEIVVPWLCLASAEERLSSSFTALMIATVPLIGALLSRASSRNEHFGRSRLFGLVVGLVGVAVLVGVDVHGTTAIAIVEVLATAAGYALGPFVVDHYLAGVPSSAVVAVSLALAGIVYLPFALTHLPRAVNLESASSLLALIVLCTWLAFALFFMLIEEVGAARATVVTYLNPAVALLLGVLLLREHFSVGIALGFPLILIGSAFATGGVRRFSLRPHRVGPEMGYGTAGEDGALRSSEPTSSS